MKQFKVDYTDYKGNPVTCYVVADNIAVAREVSMTMQGVYLVNKVAEVHAD